MTRLVVDASVVVKWLFEEEDTNRALALRRQAELIAPELLGVECANALWKKVERAEIAEDEALAAARLLAAAEIELFAMRPLLADATRLAIALNHPAYDCMYIALALAEDCGLVTADRHLLRKVKAAPELRRRVLSLADVAPI